MLPANAGCRPLTLIATPSADGGSITLTATADLNLKEWSALAEAVTALRNASWRPASGVGAARVPAGLRLLADRRGDADRGAVGCATGVRHRSSDRDVSLGATLMQPAPEIIEIPSSDGDLPLPGYFLRAGEDDRSRATVILTGGYDGSAEELYFFDGAAALARGYNVLAFDGPGQGCDDPTGAEAAGGLGERHHSGARLHASSPRRRSGAIELERFQRWPRGQRAAGWRHARASNPAGPRVVCSLEHGFRVRARNPRSDWSGCALRQVRGGDAGERHATRTAVAELRDTPAPPTTPTACHTPAARPPAETGTPPDRWRSTFDRGAQAISGRPRDPWKCCCSHSGTPEPERSLAD